MRKTSPLPTTCQEWRRVVTRRGKMDMRTGTVRMDAFGTEETQRCGVPLFSDTERAAGKCKGCASGFAAPNNRPATEEEIREATSTPAV